jgi:hypothetical protein
VANKNFPRNEDIFNNSIGSAISPTNAPNGLLNLNLTSRNLKNSKKVNFSFSNRSVSMDPSIAKLINKPILSTVYENFANQEQALNILKHKDSTNLVQHFVKESKHLQRNDVSYTSIADAIEQDL